MVDFLVIATQATKRGVEIFPKFRLYPKSTDLMIRGGDFYAIWVEEKQTWSTDEQVALQIIDRELDNFAQEYRKKYDCDVRVLYMWDSKSGMIDSWHKYCQRQMRDSFHMLDETLIFSNTAVRKNDYASKRLNYPLEVGEIKAYDRLISTLYSPEERHKIEWAIGAIVSGESKTIQKFMVLYGAAGTGKSTVLNIIEKLFDGYCSVFNAKDLGSSSSQFALEAFRTNPLVAIQHDGDLSRIDDNTRLNSLVSHELMTVNEKFKSTYSSRFKCFLFMGTNKPVKITDGKSGLIRRLIDVHPSGEKLSSREYHQLMRQIDFELGAIAWHCREVYLENPNYYDDYIPVSMLGASNDFYNFVIDSYSVFKREDGTTLKAAWEMYKQYCEDAKVPYPDSRRVFKEELKNYFREVVDRFEMDDGTRVRSYYKGFRTDKFEVEKKEGMEKQTQKNETWIVLQERQSGVFEQSCSVCLAQYANQYETPQKSWDEISTRLSELDVTKLHYVKVPENHIVIDFDLKNEAGEKSLERNIEAASRWTPTYAEVSKSGRGLHLHYLYSGDPGKLSRIFDENIEVKVFSGNSTLRRKLTRCNDLPIASISSGLPLKGDDNTVNFKVLANEKALRTLIKKNLNKEYHASTKCSMDFIYKNLKDAYESGMSYDVSDMKNAIVAFAAQSTHQSDYCLKLVGKMHFKSEETAVSTDGQDLPLIFFDIEVFPNLFVVCWKAQGKDKPLVNMINPGPCDIEELLSFRLVGFNNRRYDNHMLYARLMGYTNEQLFELSQKIINAPKGEGQKYLFGEAYNLSYTDIYDFASAGNKKSLKKLEIEMGIHHQELGLPWDKPVPEKLWGKVVKYCGNDVIATEAAFSYLSADWTARQILADLAGMSVNDTTNTLSTRIIFGNDRKPQGNFHYRDLAEPVYEIDDETRAFLEEACPEMMAQLHSDPTLPFEDPISILPFFPGYKYENGKSTYRGEEVGEGGYVYAEPGMYGNVALLDIASMHPHSVIAEVLFGVKFTTAFLEIVEGRVSIKHEAWNVVNTMLDGKLTPHIQRVINGELTAKDLANALKTAINSVYGLTSASFDNPFRDIRNKDNIVAKRGALFMVDLKNAVQEKGFTVAHIKTDSIKIPNATPEIIQFVMDFGKRYGYTFEHEDTYERMCLVNDAVYIAKYKEPHIDRKTGKKIWWTATGKQFAVPYVFKTLFSKEPISDSDMREVFSVQTALYLDMNEKLPDVTGYEKELDKLKEKYRKGFISDTLFEPEKAKLEELIATGHDYHFIGKVGQFCPVKAGAGGGILKREQNGKYNAASGTIGYRWLESEALLKKAENKTIVIDDETGEEKSVAGAEMIPGNEDIIDRSYYTKLVDDAVEAIGKYGDFEWFVSDEPFNEEKRTPDFMNIPENADEEIPFL